jgi:deoxyribonuclease-4
VSATICVRSPSTSTISSISPRSIAKSIVCFRSEVERATAIGAEYLVVHPGSYRNQSIEEAIAACVLGLRDATHGLAPRHLTILLENTAGAGCQLGSRFEELQSLRELAADLIDVPVGFCLDTCHLLAAGFDIATVPGLRATIRQAEDVLGLSHIHLIHANDSRAPLGSRIDRHEHIGCGHIGLDGFRRLLCHPKLRSKPFILETPVTQENDDRRNLDTLKALAASRHTTESRL